MGLVCCQTGVPGFSGNGSRMQAGREEAVGCQLVAVGCQPVAVGCQPRRYIARHTSYTSASERTLCKVPNRYGDFRRT